MLFSFKKIDLFNERNSNLSKLRDILWPIKSSEMKLLIPMALMMMCMLFNFAALRSIKDSLVVPNIGAEVISFLKFWIVLPSTAIFTIIYIKLSNIFNYEKLFYIIISFFLLFFLSFIYIIFPHQEIYHPDIGLIKQLLIVLPNLKWFILIFGKWSYALMYVFCELWSAVVINLLFWQYANHICNTSVAKRFYPILGMIGNIGLMLAGIVLVTCTDSMNLTSDIEVFTPIINAVVISGISCMLLYAYINRVIIIKNFSDDISNPEHLLHSKTTLSVIDSIKLLLKSKYIGHIVLLVLFYGLLINILEGPWKSKIRELYPNSIEYLNFMGQFNIWMGISCMIFMILGSNILRRSTWLISASITPYMLGITGCVFFICVLFSEQIADLGLIINPLYFAVIIGAVQNILSKATKYSLFDATKEMAYIPLSLELRTKGKAAVEVMGLKFGKALGAFMQSFIFILMPMASFDSVSVYLLGVLIIIIPFWFWNIKVLNHEYTELMLCK